MEVYWRASGMTQWVNVIAAKSATLTPTVASHAYTLASKLTYTHMHTHTHTSIHTHTHAWTHIYTHATQVHILSHTHDKDRPVCYFREKMNQQTTKTMETTQSKRHRKKQTARQPDPETTTEW